jgi:hypothetical protein
MKRTEQEYLGLVFKTFIFLLKEQTFIDISKFSTSAGLKELAGLPLHAF